MNIQKILSGMVALTLLAGMQVGFYAGPVVAETFHNFLNKAGANQGKLDDDTGNSRFSGIELNASDLALGTIPAARIGTGDITTGKLGNDAVTGPKVLNGTLGEEKLSFDTATEAELTTHTGIASAHHAKTVSSDIDHDAITGVSTADHHTKTVSADIDHDSITGVSTNDHHTPTVDTNAKTLCADGEYLRGEDSTTCRTSAQVVSDGGGLTSVNASDVGAGTFPTGSFDFGGSTVTLGSIEFRPIKSDADICSSTFGAHGTTAVCLNASNDTHIIYKSSGSAIGQWLAIGQNVGAC